MACFRSAGRSPAAGRVRPARKNGASPARRGGTIEAINHTSWAINRFSVNGQSGLDIIGPYSGAAGAAALE
jgi:hypothetical protein